MFPKEHGAYGQLLFPLATALAIARPGVSSLALAGAAMAAFVAHEPLLVLTGQRGARAARERRDQAWRWFGAFATSAAVLGAVGIARMPPGGRVALLIPAVLAAVLAAIIAIHREHTTGGEIVSALTFASLSLPVAIASRAADVAAITCALVYAGTFVVATLSVRAIIVWTRHPLGRMTRVGACVAAAAVIAVLLALVREGWVTRIAPWAALPVCVLGFVLAAWAPPPKHLRTFGWFLIGATLLQAVLLIAALR